MSMSNVNSQMKVSISHSNLFKSVQAYRVLLHIKWEKDKFEPDQVNCAKKMFTHFLFIFVCVCVSLSLPYHKSSSRSLLSPDDKVSENIWFVWSSLYHTVEVNGDVTMQSADGPPTNKCNV